MDAPVRLACSGPPSAAQPSPSLAGAGWGRQASLPVYSFLEQRGTFGGGMTLNNAAVGGGGGCNNHSSGSISPSPASIFSGVSSSTRSPRPPPLSKQAKSLHAQTHKLRRQVTICEDSISIADSALMSRQGSRSDSRASLIAPQLGRQSLIDLQTITVQYISGFVCTT